MDLRQLRYFTRIVDLGSITAAAQSLYIAQPSLSQHVANLESELGIQLLVRAATGTRATHAGEILYRHSKMLLRAAEEAKSAVRHGYDAPAGRVTLGFPTSTSRLLVVPLVDTLIRCAPDVLLEIVEGSSADLAFAVSQHRMDMSIAMDAQPQPEHTTTVPLWREELFLVGHRLPSTKITLEQMACLPLILPSFPNSIRVLTQRAFTQNALAVNLVAETSAVAVLLALVSAGKGWTILPASAVRDMHESAIVATQIDAPGFSRRASLCTSSANENSAACACVQRMLLEVARTIITTGSWGTNVIWIGENSRDATTT